MREKTIDLPARILLHHELISYIHFSKPLPALEKLNAEIVQHIRELKKHSVRPVRNVRPGRKRGGRR